MATEIKLDDQTQEKLVTILVEDLDASQHLAEEAVARFVRDNGDEPVTAWETLQDLAEEIHGTQSYWED